MLWSGCLCYHLGCAALLLSDVVRVVVWQPLLDHLGCAALLLSDVVRVVVWQPLFDHLFPVLFVDVQALFQGVCRIVHLLQNKNICRSEQARLSTVLYMVNHIGRPCIVTYTVPRASRLVWAAAVFL